MSRRSRPQTPVELTENQRKAIEDFAKKLELVIENYTPVGGYVNGDLVLARKAFTKLAADLFPNLTVKDDKLGLVDKMESKQFKSIFDFLGFSEEIIRLIGLSKGIKGKNNQGVFEEIFDERYLKGLCVSLEGDKIEDLVSKIKSKTKPKAQDKTKPKDLVEAQDDANQAPVRTVRIGGFAPVAIPPVPQSESSGPGVLPRADSTESLEPAPDARQFSTPSSSSEAGPSLGPLTKRSTLIPEKIKQLESPRDIESPRAMVSTARPGSKTKTAPQPTKRDQDLYSDISNESKGNVNINGRMVQATMRLVDLKLSGIPLRYDLGEGMAQMIEKVGIALINEGGRESYNPVIFYNGRREEYRLISQGQDVVRSIIDSEVNKSPECLDFWLKARKQFLEHSRNAWTSSAESASDSVSQFFDPSKAFFFKKFAVVSEKEIKREWMEKIEEAIKTKKTLQKEAEPSRQVRVNLNTVFEGALKEGDSASSDERSPTPHSTQAIPSTGSLPSGSEGGEIIVEVDNDSNDEQDSVRSESAVNDASAFSSAATFTSTPSAKQEGDSSSLSARVSQKSPSPPKAKPPVSPEAGLPSSSNPPVSQGRVAEQRVTLHSPLPSKQSSLTEVRMRGSGAFTPPSKPQVPQFGPGPAKPLVPPPLSNNVEDISAANVDSSAIRDPGARRFKVPLEERLRVPVISDAEKPVRKARSATPVDDSSDSVEKRSASVDPSVARPVAFVASLPTIAGREAKSMLPPADSSNSAEIRSASVDPNASALPPRAEVKSPPSPVATSTPVSNAALPGSVETGFVPISSSDTAVAGQSIPPAPTADKPPYIRRTSTPVSDVVSSGSVKIGSVPVSSSVTTVAGSISAPTTQPPFARRVKTPTQVSDVVLSGSTEIGFVPVSSSVPAAAGSISAPAANKSGYVRRTPTPVSSAALSGSTEIGFVPVSSSVPAAAGSISAPAANKSGYVRRTPTPVSSAALSGSTEIGFVPVSSSVPAAAGSISAPTAQPTYARKTRTPTPVPDVVLSGSNTPVDPYASAPPPQAIVEIGPELPSSADTRPSVPVDGSVPSNTELFHSMPQSDAEEEKENQEVSSLSAVVLDLPEDNEEPSSPKPSESNSVKNIVVASGGAHDGVTQVISALVSEVSSRFASSVEGQASNPSLQSGISSEALKLLPSAPKHNPLPSSIISPAEGQASNPSPQPVIGPEVPKFPSVPRHNPSSPIASAVGVVPAAPNVPAASRPSPVSSRAVYNPSAATSAAPPVPSSSQSSFSTALDSAFHATKKVAGVLGYAGAILGGTAAAAVAVALFPITIPIACGFRDDIRNAIGNSVVGNYVCEKLDKLANVGGKISGAFSKVTERIFARRVEESVGFTTQNAAMASLLSPDAQNKKQISSIEPVPVPDVQLPRHIPPHQPSAAPMVNQPVTTVRSNESLRETIVLEVPSGVPSRVVREPLAVKLSSVKFYKVLEGMDYDVIDTIAHAVIVSSDNCRGAREGIKFKGELQAQCSKCGIYNPTGRPIGFNGFNTISGQDKEEINKAISRIEAAGKGVEESRKYLKDRAEKVINAAKRPNNATQKPSRAR